jgi:hypothetical protein
MISSDVREVNVEDGMQQSKDDKLLQDADCFIYDVSLFDNHFMSSSDIKVIIRYNICSSLRHKMCPNIPYDSSTKKLLRACKLSYFCLI